MTAEPEKFVLEDGRKAEKVIVEKVISKDEVERVIEVKAEEFLPLKTQQRITEKLKSFVCERRTETIDQRTGEVIDVKIETFSSPDQVVGATQENVSSLSKGKKLKSLGAIEEVDVDSTKESTIYSKKDILLATIIVAQVLGLAYLLLSN
jgi:hypothetical protein